MDAHPAVTFRDGPAGRRATIVGGPDVWEVVPAIRDARAAEPELTQAEVLELVTENTGTAPSSVRVALDYYGAYPEEVDSMVAANDRADDELEMSMRRTSALLAR